MRLWSVFLTMAATVCVLTMSPTAHAADQDSLERLLDAIAQVESRKDANAVGDSGRAIGVYQIHRPYWQDGTRILGVDWSYKDARDPAKARQIVRAYLKHYGRGKSLLDIARIHNGGPQGHRKKATRPYARKIQAILNDSDQTS